MSMLASCATRPVYQNVYAYTLLISKPSGTYCALKVVHSTLHDIPKNISNHSPRTPATRPHTTSSTGSHWQTISVVQVVAELPSWNRPGAESSVVFASVSSSSPPSQSGSLKRTCRLRQEAAPDPEPGLALLHEHERRRRRSQRKYFLHRPCLRLRC